MSSVLEKRVDAAADSAETLNEQLATDHQGAMFCYDVQDLIRSIVSLHADINGSVRRWQASIAQYPESQELVAIDWHSLYRKLADICLESSKLVKVVEENGHSVDGKEDFLKGWKEIRGIACFSMQDVANSIEQIRTGNVRPLGDVTNELWNAPV